MRTLCSKDEAEVVGVLKEYIPDASVELLEYKLSDLGISSMDFITLVFDIEEMYSVEIDVSNIEMNDTLRGFLTTSMSPAS